MAYFLLVDLYRGAEGGMNPFLPLFLRALEKTQDHAERQFLIHLLTSPPANRDVAASTAERVLDEFAGAERPMPDAGAVRRLYAARVPKAPPVMTAATRPTLAVPSADADTAPGKPALVQAAALKGATPLDGTAPPAASVTAAELEGMRAELPAPGKGDAHPVLRMRGMEPTFVRPLPPCFPAAPEEVVWLNPDDGPGLLWDATMCQEASPSAEVKDLMALAFKGPLQPEQQKLLVDRLQSDPRLVHGSGLTPPLLPDLVNNNPMLAYECLLHLMSSPQITEYLAALVNMDMSLHSMEVVNRLTTSVELPTEFIHLYISNCINCCEVRPVP